jgi:hypothetical protein
MPVILISICDVISYWSPNGQIVFGHRTEKSDPTIMKTNEKVKFFESTTTRIAGGLDFTAIGGKRQGREVPPSLQVKPGAKHPVWKTQSSSDLQKPAMRLFLIFRFCPLTSSF